jgi:hypothetical protein
MRALIWKLQYTYYIRSLTGFSIPTSWWCAKIAHQDYGVAFLPRTAARNWIWEARTTTFWDRPQV